LSRNKKKEVKMKPELVAISGPLVGKTWSIHGESSIGRDRSNQLCVNDASVSRKHSLIKQEGEQFTISDLNSHNGTFVNGALIRVKTLNHGDSITIGDSTFIFALNEEAEDQLASNPVEIEEVETVARDKILLQSNEAFYLSSEKVLATPPDNVRLAHDLNALLKISTAINSVRNLAGLKDQLLESIFELAPAQRGAILIEDGRGALSKTFGRERHSTTDKPIKVSRTLITQAMDKSVSVLINDLERGDSFNEAESLHAFHVNSALCVPLTTSRKVIGVIYLDTTDTAVRFDENHLQLITAVAAMAAIAIENVQHLEALASENERLRVDASIEHNMVGESPRMQEVYNVISKVASTDSTVMILGESGTGKELAARAIHKNSARSARPFVAINCAVITDTLLESELFGHEKGSFTGAIVQKKGKLEVADGGTVFLDEIGEMAPLLQAKLLRVLQEREFERVGGSRPIKINIRIIAATNRNLREAIADGRFRQDLFYRLFVVSVMMPPLKERGGDIGMLANYFIAKYSQKCKRRVNGISSAALDYLTGYDWPGNVRELENAIERAVVMGVTESIVPEDLPENVLASNPSDGASDTNLHDAVREAKKQLVLRAFEQANGNHAAAATALGVHPNNLYRLLRNLGLKAE
jgi:Nif-specific regulatory protein